MTGIERTMLALTGDVVTPPPCGASFVPLEALPGAAVGMDVASSFARAYADARLDFAFVPSWDATAPALAARLRADGIAVLWAVPGVFSAALSSVGHAAGLRALGRDPDSLTPALEEAEVVMRRAVEAGITGGVDAIVVADDLAGPAGPFAAPEYLESHVVARLARAATAARAAGLPAILHSDGDVSSLLGALARAGYAGVHVGGVGDQAFEQMFGEARAQRMVLLGGLGAHTLVLGLAAAVGAGTRLATLARSGPLLVADDGGMTTSREYSALLAAFSAVRGRL